MRLNLAIIATLLMVMLAPSSGWSLDITDGVTNQEQQNNNGGATSQPLNIGTAVVDQATQNNGGINGNTNIGTGVVNPGTGGGGGAAGGGSSAVSALNKICGVTPQNGTTGQLQIFSVGVKCFENIVNGLAEETITNFSGYLNDIVYTMLVLYLIFYGAKTSLGFSGFTGEGAKKEFFIHIMKVAFVAWLVFSLGLIDIYHLVLGAYYDLINIVLSNADYGECNNAAAGNGEDASTNWGGGGTEAIWATMDCMFSKFIGWESANGYGGTPWTAVPLLFGYITSKLLPANGFIIGGLLFSTIWTLLTSFFRLAFVYILSMIALILLFAISPLAIPMMLFSGTKPYFDNWWKLVLAMVLQPVILFAFFAFVASLLSDTVTKLKDVFNKMKPSFQTSGTDTSGTHTAVNSVSDFVGALGKNVDAEMLKNSITTLVVAYLLISFISFVSKIALELAGAGSATPDLGELSKMGSR